MDLCIQFYSERRLINLGLNIKETLGLVWEYKNDEKGIMLYTSLLGLYFSYITFIYEREE